MAVENARRAGGLMRTVRAGLAHHQAGRLDRAEALYRKALQSDPDHADALHLLGVVAYQCGQIEPAIRLIERALARLAEFPDAHLNHGNALRAAGRPAEAIESYHRAVALDPDHGTAHCNLGVALAGLGRLDEAIESYRRALTLSPDRAEPHYNMANALQAGGRVDEAVIHFWEALVVKPDFVEAHNNLGNALQEQGRLDEAVASYRQALLLRPDFAEAHNNLGNALQKQGRFDEAVASFRQALRLETRFCGGAQEPRQRPHIAARDPRCDRLLPASGGPRPLDAAALAAWFHQRQHICDWAGYREDEARVRSAINARPAFGTAFMLQALSSTPKEQLECARQVAATLKVQQPVMLARRQPKPAGQIRLGYLSADFRQHAVAMLIPGLFEHHDAGISRSSAIRPVRMTAAT